MHGIHWDKMDAEERASMQRFLQEELEKHTAEYIEKGIPAEDWRYCPYCGQLLRYGSISYDEGFHIDSCE